MPRTKRSKTPHEERPAVIAGLEAWLSEGKTLRDFCRQEGKPSYSTIYAWLEEDKDAAERIARARQLGFDAIAQECLEIADDGSNDWMQTTGRDKEPGWQLNGEHVQRSKLRVWSRLQLLAKWDPKRYGDRMTQEHTGPGGGPVQYHVVTGIARGPGQTLPSGDDGGEE